MFVGCHLIHLYYSPQLGNESSAGATRRDPQLFGSPQPVTQKLLVGRKIMVTPESKTPVRKRFYPRHGPPVVAGQHLTDRYRITSTRSFFLLRQFSTLGKEPPFEHIDIDDLYVYFPSFHRLHTINLSDVHISSDIPERIEMFSHCQQVLSSLILVDVSLPWRSFITLIDYFPNLRNLELSTLAFDDDNINPLPLSRPLRGKLCFYLSEAATVTAFSDWLFTGPVIEYDELVADVGYFSAAHFQQIITACGKSLKRLKLEVCECFVPRTILTPLTNQEILFSSGCSCDTISLSRTS